MNYCLIPCKSKSKRLPGKNFKEFMGVPIWYKVLTKALDSKVIHHMDIMTDDEKMIEGHHQFPFLRALQINVIKEPSEITDCRTLSDVVDDYLHVKGITEGKLCLLLPTAVFIQPDDIIEISKTKSVKTVFIGKKIDKKALNCYINGRKIARNRYGNSVSQDLPQPYIDTGQMYWIDIKNYMKKGMILGEYATPHDLGFDPIDIDTQEDWDAAEKLYKRLFK